MTDSVASIEARVAELVRQGAADPTVEVVSTSSFVEDLGYHSLALVELGFAVEEEFDLDPIEANEVENIGTVGQLAAFVATRLAVAELD